MDISDVEKRFAEHRAKAFITCPEDCMCWDIEKLLFVIETTRPTTVAADLPYRCSECGHDRAELDHYPNCGAA